MRQCKVLTTCVSIRQRKHVRASVNFVSRSGVGVGLVGGAAAAAVALGVGVVHADTGDDVINGWMLTPTSDTADTLTNATLLDPSDSLGLGTSPIAGEFDSYPAMLSSVGTVDQFITPPLSSDYLFIQDAWLPGIEQAVVRVNDSSSLSYLVPVDGDHQVVDLVNFGGPHSPPLFNPDATGPIDIGGVQLADPQDGALLNDLADAVFTGDTADFSKATTLFDDLLGVTSTSVAADVAAGGGSDATSAADLASGLDLATVVDPSMFADLLSSIGF